MADVTIEAAASSALKQRSLRGGVFWTSPTVGYVIYPNTGADLVYRKTADGGATWGAAQAVVAAAACDAFMYDCWADWQTSGDAGTKIHIAYISRDLNQIRYVYLDTSDDSVGGNDLIEACQGTGTFNVVIGFGATMVSISKTRGGNLVVALAYQDNAPTYFSSFYTSPDADTWTSKASPYEAYGDNCLLFPANLADNQDVWGVYWDADAEAISLKTFDDSGNSWSEQAISGGMVPSILSMQMDGAIRLSDGHLILAAWSGFNVATADLMTWDINGAGSITAKTNVITDTAEYALVSVFVNQANDDIYVAYAGGTDFTTLVKVFYQLSQNGGGSWDGQAAMQANVEDDERWISAGTAKKEWGGKFQPVWFNDDLNDLFTNTDNGISIAAVVAVAVGGGAIAIAGALELDYTLGIQVDETAVTILKASPVVENRIEERSIANFTIIDTPGTASFTKGMLVKIYDPNNVLIFGGLIDNPETIRIAPSGGLLHPNTCIDYHYFADKRLIAESYEDKTCGFIVEDVFDKYLAAEGVTIGNIELGPTLVQAVFNYPRVTDAYDALAEKAGKIWLIDKNKALYFQGRDVTAAPWTLTGNDIIKGSSRLSGENPLYRNRQYIRGGKGTTSLQTETFTGDGVNVAFTVGYSIVKVPTVTVNAVGQTVGIKGIDTAMDCYWSKGDPVLVFDAGSIPGAVAVVIAYYGEYDVLAVVEDPAQIASQQTIEGSGTGYVEDISDESTLTDTDALLDSGKAKLSRFAVTAKRLHFTTVRTGLEPGQIQTVAYPAFGLADDMLIESVITNIIADKAYYEVTSIIGPVTGSWAKYFNSLSLFKQEIIDRLNVGTEQILIILISESEIWEWTEDITETVYACTVVNGTVCGGATPVVC